ncbi:disease resistance protein RPP13-like [Camellia sinensis]|uniref:disease resistance protein RPP13-like n=1 Tax=Camellia sinensis TaxID=4442 RepID=UPI00103667BD|nr:disease resistance protein RPP13-like [Camellia sinensis]
MQHDVLVGRGDVEKELITRLTDNEEEKSLCVISLVSEEALGKTALARNVYNKVDIRQHFQCRAWLHVAKDFTYKDLLLAIIKQIPICGVLADVELMSEHQLSALLFQILIELCTPFTVVANGSRVILTTRDSKVASEVDPWGHPLKLMRLSDEESCKLFLKVVNGANHDNLNNFKVGIVRICRGLPPTIVLLGGLFSSIQPNDEWSGVTDHLSQYLGDDDQSVDLLTIVALSYHELPYVLKPCFLCLTLFPKAYEIPTQRLLQLWIAKEFIQISTTTTTSVLEPEDLAKAYLEELVSTNMIEIATWKEHGSPKTCRMSSFLYNVFLPKDEDIGFLQIHHCNSHVHESNQIIRRLADHYVGVKSTLESHTQHLCSYVSFEAQKQGTSNREAKNLRHLFMNEVSIAKPSSKESSRTNLQTLMGLLLGAKDPYEYGLDWFTSLRKLGVSCHPKSAEKTAKCISGLDKLQTLRLRSKD